MQALHRHQLAYLRPIAWRQIAARDWDPLARECLSHWAAHGLPLVITQQTPHDEGVALGLSAPIVWDRRRIALRVPRDGIDHFADFPWAAELITHMPRTARAALGRVLPLLDALGVHPRVYGSHGWQRITGLPCVHAASDIDLWVGAADAPQADAVAKVLTTSTPQHGEPRLDGELMLPGGGAVAWREWAAWRAGGMRGEVLVKRIDGPALEDGGTLFDGNGASRSLAPPQPSPAGGRGGRNIPTARAFSSPPVLR